MADDVGKGPFVFGWDVGSDDSDTTVVGRVNPDGSVTIIDVAERIHAPEAIDMETDADGVWRLPTHG